VSWMYEYGNFRRFSQMLIVALPSGIVAQQLETVLQTVLDRHDMLRARVDVIDGDYRLITRPPGSVAVQDILTRVSGPADQTLVSHAQTVIDGIDPFGGAMVKALWCDTTDSEAGRLLLVVHHLATDAVSWYVLLAGLASAWSRLGEPEPVALPGEYTTYREWSRLLERRSRSSEITAQRDYWLGQLAGPDPILGARLPDPVRDTWKSLRMSGASVAAAETRVLLDKIAATGGDIGVREVLLTALTLTLTSWRLRRGDPAGGGVLVALEGHGREDILVGSDDPEAVEVDTSTTVGWFTNVFPVRLGAAERPLDIETACREPASARELLRAVTDHVAAVPNGGLDYGLLRYQRRDPELAAAAHPQVELNYLGRLDLGPMLQPGAPWTPLTDTELTDSVPLAGEPDLPLRYTFDVVVAVEGTPEGPRLRTNWIWSELLTTEEEAGQLAGLWGEAIAALADAL
jgi:mycobactin peptide synthetase MbtF